jgi:hypothetical protein
MSQAITLSALLSKVQTMVDGGWRLTFDVTEADTVAVMQLSQLRDQVLAVSIAPEQLIGKVLTPGELDDLRPMDMEFGDA